MCVAKHAVQVGDVSQTDADAARAQRLLVKSIIGVSTSTLWRAACQEAYRWGTPYLSRVVGRACCLLAMSCSDILVRLTVNET